MPSRLAPGMHGDYRVPGRYREKDIAFLYMFLKFIKDLF